jgi:DNA-binding GntR family transcriptional regulator
MLSSEKRISVEPAHEPERTEFLFEPIQPPTLKDRVAAQIHVAILTGDLAPGARIVESRLAKQMNVAQTTVREAMQDLETQGLVVKYVNRETVVRTFTREDLESLFHLRIVLEGLAVEWAHPYASEETLAPLYQLAEGMRAAALRNAIPEFYEIDLRFHRKLWSLAQNEFLERALIPLSVGPIAFVLAGSPVPLKGNYVQVAGDHVDILDALKTTTPKGARKVMEEKLRSWHRLQLPGFRERNS